MWGDGNILLGGGGSDLIEGRGADDIIDGDKYVNVRLSVRNRCPAVEIGSAGINETGQSAMTSQYLRDGNGALTGPRRCSRRSSLVTVDPGQHRRRSGDRGPAGQHHGVDRHRVVLRSAGQLHHHPRAPGSSR